MATTPPLLTAVVKLAAGESAVFTLYQGINLTILPDGQSASYSFVDTDKQETHDTPTTATISVKTTIPSEWPFVRVLAIGGTIRVGLV